MHEKSFITSERYARYFSTILLLFQLLNVKVSRINGIDTVKETLQRLSVNHSVSAVRVSNSKL